MIPSYTPEMLLKIVDLFCGAGGVTCGLEAARYNGVKCAEVVACVNHDPLAIRSHAANYPNAQHFTEDIRTLDVVQLPTKQTYPNAYLFLWASLECIHHSLARGGKPRDADSRTLAEHLIRYVLHMAPDYILVENVREFMSWGPLDEQGKPIHREKGVDYLAWVESMCALGYQYTYRLLNAADFGAHTSRQRYFGMFHKPGLPPVFPEPSHAKDPAKVGGLRQKWKAVREVLNLHNEGKSIFDRPKPLVDKTLQRIYAGLCKYVANGQEAFITKWLGNDPVTGINQGKSIEDPLNAITCQNRIGLVKPAFIMQNNADNIPSSPDAPARTLTTEGGNLYPVFLKQANGDNPKSRVTGLDTPARALTASGAGHQDLVFISKAYSGDPDGKNISPEDPAGSLTMVDHHQLIFMRRLAFLMKYHSSGGQHVDPNNPASSLTTHDRLASVWIDKNYGSRPHNHQSIDAPAGTVTANDKQSLMSAEPWVTNFQYEDNGTSVQNPCPALVVSRRYHYLVNPQYTSPGASVEKPCPTIIAGSGKRPLSLATVVYEDGSQAEAYVPTNWLPQEGDSPTLTNIRAFMQAFGISDILMRMLTVDELMRITGLPEDYVLLGSQSKQKWFIGNAVPCIVPQRWAEALYGALVKDVVYA